MKTAWTVLISILILLVGPGFCRSDTLYLKDGSVINSESVQYFFKNSGRTAAGILSALGRSDGQTIS